LVHAPATTDLRDAPHKHLTAVPSPKRVTDRREARFVPKYVEFSLPPAVDDRPNAKRRILGYGLKTGPADLYSAIIELLGTPLDGKRGDFTPRDPVNASYLRKRYGWTYDQIGAWTRQLEKPQPCPHCERGHALLRVHRPKHGGSYRYELVRCQELSDDACVAYDDARPVPRKRTGALPGRQSTKRTSSQLELLAPEKVSEKPDTFPPPAEPAAEVEPIANDDPRVQIVVGIARFHALELRDDVAIVIAQHAAAAGATTAAEYEAAVLRLTATAGIAQKSINDLDAIAIQSTIAAAPLQITSQLDQTTTPSPPKVSGFSDTSGTLAWDINRCLELARRSEPRTTVATATRYRDEIVAMLQKHGIRDPRNIEDEVARILTDHRIVGKPDEPQRTPFRFIRGAIRDGEKLNETPWILTPAHLDDGSGQLARAYAKLPIGQREAIERIICDHLAGDPLDFKRLGALGVSSKQMTRFVVERVRAKTG
jgi:hypothetical protein